MNITKITVGMEGKAALSVQGVKSGRISNLNTL
jgi:hypothetical protein